MKKVLVIGAGVAGISAAIRLSENGFAVTLVESRSFVGGRTYSIFDKATGETIDNGQHIFAGAYNHFFYILEKLGTIHSLEKQRHLKVKFYDKSSDSYTLDTSLLPGRLGTLAALMKIDKFNISSKIRIACFFIKISFNLIDADGLTALELLKEEKQSDDTIRYFWEPLILATCNGPIKEISANLFITVLKQAFFSKKERASLVFSKVPLQALLSPIDDYLKRKNGELLLKKTVKSIIFEGNKASGVQFQDSSVIQADYIVSALPSDSCFSIMPENVKKFCPLASRLRYSPITSVYLWYDIDFLAESFAGFIGSPVQWIFNQRKISDCDPSQKENFPGHYALTISASNDFLDKSNEEVLKICTGEINTYLPASYKANLLRSKVIKAEKATLLISPEIDSIRPGQRTPIQNLFIAGDWTDTKLPATIESAAKSGFLVSNLMINQDS